MVFALIGNQNCGKTTLFNQLTGSNQHVGNFPGVTVEKKEGVIKKAQAATVVDLPGIYSLSPYTAEEVVTRDFLLKEKPDAIINIVDATNIERNLYLTLQLIELNMPMVLALNMMDEVTASGGSIDVQTLEQALGIPVVPISASKNEGISELVEPRRKNGTGSRLARKRWISVPGESAPCDPRRGAFDRGSLRRLRVSPLRFAATKLVEGDELTHTGAESESKTRLKRWSISQRKWRMPWERTGRRP